MTLALVLFWHFFQRLIFSERAGALVRRIAWLSVGGIFVSVSAFLLVLFVMNGMNRSIHDRILALEPSLSLTSPDLKIDLETDPAWAHLSGLGGVRWSRFESADVILRSVDGQFQGARARGIERDSLMNFLSEVRRLRTAPSSRDADALPLEEPREGEVFVGIDLARSLGVFEGDALTVVPPETLLLPPGEAPRVEQVRVAKILATNLADLDGQALFYVRGQALKGLRRSAAAGEGIDVWIPAGENAERVKKRLLATGTLLKVETWMDRNSSLFFALKMEKIMIGIFLGLAGLIAASSILTVMSLLLAQKRRDIAMLRVLGLSAQHTVGLFTRIGLLLAAFSVGGGMIVGVAAGLYIEKNPLNVLPDIYYDSLIPAEVDFRLVLFAVTVAAMVAFLGAWIPARTTSKLPVSETMRKA